MKKIFWLDGFEGTVGGGAYYRRQKSPCRLLRMGIKTTKTNNPKPSEAL